MTILAILLACAWGMFAWQDSRRAILWFPILLPLYLIRLKLGPLPTTALELSAITTIIGATMRHGSMIWKEGWQQTAPWRMPAGIWIAATLIGVLISPIQLASLGLWRAYILEPLIFFILLLGTLKKQEDRQMLFQAFVVTSCGIALWSLFQFLTGKSIPHPWDTDILTRRATGPFPFPNAVALFCAPIAALSFGMIMNAVSKRERLIAWIGFLSATIATLLAKSVGGSIAIFACALLVLLTKKRARTITIGASILLLLAVFLISPIRTKVQRTLTFNEWSGKVRTIMWKETWTMLKDRPIVGAGFGAYPVVIKPYHKATFLEIFQYPHNILLNLWSETGLLGIFAFAWICIVWIRMTRRAAGSWQLAASGMLPLIAILVHGLVDVPYFKNDLAFAFWIFAAVATPMVFHKNEGTNS